MKRPDNTSRDMTERSALSTDERDRPSPPTQVAAKERVFVGTGLFWGLIIGVVLAIGVLVLVAQNTGSITVAFLGWEFATPLIVVILGALLVGVVFAELFGVFYRTRRRRAQRDRDHLDRLQQSHAVS